MPLLWELIYKQRNAPLPASLPLLHNRDSLNY